MSDSPSGVSTENRHFIAPVIIAIESSVVLSWRREVLYRTRLKVFPKLIALIRPSLHHSLLSWPYYTPVANQMLSLFLNNYRFLPLSCPCASQDDFVLHIAGTIMETVIVYIFSNPLYISVVQYPCSIKSRSKTVLYDCILTSSYTNNKLHKSNE